MTYELTDERKAILKQAAFILKQMSEQTTDPWLYEQADTGRHMLTNIVVHHEWKVKPDELPKV